MKKEFSLTTQLKEIVPNRIAYFVEWWMTPEEERIPFEELSRKNLQDVPFEVTKEWIKRQDVQEAMQFYLKKTKTLNMVKIYQKQLEKALQGDVNSAKWIESFSKSEFFNESTDEIHDFLRNVDIPALKKKGGE
ncbi:hypothetical protein [Clostridium sp. BNL1100]|jgi:hypothetical protein|uniref:hypothetical protein n=1 Tax=Clostridium sp. BNL1100 TaxID=755731 RepID=UPI00024A7760|nr:hypothetical protein [Clostridium sp. BNL1100]AEY67839.1 hypothetical protein Clo1100_3720 [Clostridium sp. BNL1100]